MSSPLHPPETSEIATLAYRLWEQDGCPPNCSEAHWFKACEILSSSSLMASVEANPWLRPTYPNPHAAQASVASGPGPDANLSS